MTMLRKLFAGLGIKVDRSSFDQGDKRIDDLKKGLREATDVAHKLGKGLKTAVSGFVGFQAAKGFIRSVVDATVENERLAAQLDAVTGSAKKGAAAFRFISRFALRVPGQINQVTSAFSTLKAAGLDPSEENLVALGNLASTTGVSFDKAAQALSKANLGLIEELRSAFNITGKVTKDNVELVVQGVKTKVKRSGNNIAEFLLNVGKTKFAGGMERQMNTLGGKLSNVQDAVTAFKVEVGKGISPAIIRFANFLLKASEGSDSLAKRIGGTLSDALDAARAGLAFLSTHGEQVKSVLKGLAVVWGVNKVATIAYSGALTAQLLPGLKRLLGNLPRLVADLWATSAAAWSGARAFVATRYAALRAFLTNKPLAVLRAGIVGLAKNTWAWGKNLARAAWWQLRLFATAPLKSFGLAFSALRTAVVAGAAAMRVALMSALGPLLIIGVAVAVVVAAFRRLSEQGGEGFAKLKETVMSFVETAKELFNAVVEAVSELIEALIPVVEPIVSLVGKGLAFAFKVIVKAFKVIVAVLKPVLKIVGALISILVKLADVLIGAVVWAFEKLADVAEAIFGPIIEPIKDALNEIVEFIKGIIREIPSEFLTDELRQFAGIGSSDDTRFRALKTLEEAKGLANIERVFGPNARGPSGQTLVQQHVDKVEVNINGSDIATDDVRRGVAGGLKDGLDLKEQGLDFAGGG